MASTVTAAELGYLDGVTSAIQTQLNGKASSSHTHTGTQVNGLTASRALVSNSSGQVSVSTVTSTELSRLDGVTSNVQTQLNGKASSSSFNITSSSLGGSLNSAFNYEINMLRKSYKCVTFTFNIKPKSVIKIQNGLQEVNLGTIPSGYRPAAGVCTQLISGNGLGIYIDINTGGRFLLYINGGVLGRPQMDIGDTISSTISWITS